MLAPGMILSAPHIGRCVLKSSLCSTTTCNCVSRENPDFEFPTAGRATEKNYMPDLSVYCFLSSITFLTSSRATLSAYTCQTGDSNSSVLKNQSDVFFIFTADISLLLVFGSAALEKEENFTLELEQHTPRKG